MAHNSMYEEQLAFYMPRHPVKLGINTRAQINCCRSETNTPAKMSERVKHDIFNIRKCSFRMDLSLICKMAFNKWTGENAFSPFAP